MALAALPDNQRSSAASRCIASGGRVVRVHKFTREGRQTIGHQPLQALLLVSVLVATMMCNAAHPPRVSYRCFLGARDASGPAEGVPADWHWRGASMVAAVAAAACVWYLVKKYAIAPAPGICPLTDMAGAPVPANVLHGKSVALYFAGSWCPMCTEFTPKLRKFMGMKSSGNRQVVLVSSDFSREAFSEHLASMSPEWLAVPWGSEAQDALKRKYMVWGGREAPVFGKDRRSGLPTLIVVDPQTGEELRHLDAEGQGESVLDLW